MRSHLLFAALVALFLGWNLPNHYPLWTTFHGELMAAVAICLLFVAILWPPAPEAGAPAGAKQGRVVRLPLPTASRVWLAIALLPLIQFGLGSVTFRGDAILGFLYALGVALSLYAGHLWAAQAGRAPVLRALFVTIVLAGIVAAGLALVQWLRLPNPGWWAMDLIEGRPYGNFAQPNLFGLLMVTAIVAATALFEMRVLSHRASYALVVSMLGFAMLVSESRASLAALLAIVLCWFATRRRAATRLRVVEVLVVLAVGFALYRALPLIEQALYLKAEVPREILDAGPRQWIWLHFWRAIVEHPWLGYGFGQGVAALREVAAQVHPSRNTIYAHNLVLDLMTWFGIPVAVLLSTALGVWMLRWLRRTADGELAMQRHWVFAVWLALLVQSLLEFPYAHTFFLLPAALLAGVVIDVPKAARQAGGKITASRPALAFAAIGAVLLAAVTFDYLRLEADFRDLRFARANFTTKPEQRPLTEPLVLDQFAALNATALIKVRAGMTAAELSSLGTVARRFHLLPTRIDFAKALALNGRMDDARAELQMVRAVHHPKRFEAIDREWQAWLAENRALIPAVQR